MGNTDPPSRQSSRLVAMAGVSMVTRGETSMRVRGGCNYDWSQGDLRGREGGEATPLIKTKQKTKQNQKKKTSGCDLASRPGENREGTDPELLSGINYMTAAVISSISACKLLRLRLQLSSAHNDFGLCVCVPSLGVRFYAYLNELKFEYEYNKLKKTEHSDVFSNSSRYLWPFEIDIWHKNLQLKGRTFTMHIK